MGIFEPNYLNIVKAAKNITPDRMPLYEHIISDKVMGKILNKDFSELINGNRSEKKEYFTNYVNFFKQMGYDTVSYECCTRNIMPGSGALDKHIPGVIRERSDFEKYPWQEIKDIYFKAYAENFELLNEVMPEGMRAIGGPGNGIFECVQDLVGYEDLTYMSVDDPDLYAEMFFKVGSILKDIWTEFMSRYSDIYCVMRFGDDLGFKSATLLKEDDIRKYIIPGYKNIIELVHSYKKPFLLHSCGKIFSIMEDLINVAGIDAKHSNEDQIAPFTEWVVRYGDRIGNFGGIDTDMLCSKPEDVIKKHVSEVVNFSVKHNGFALGSGNSIPEYVPEAGYLAMVETARSIRGK